MQQLLNFICGEFHFFIIFLLFELVQRKQQSDFQVKLSKLKISPLKDWKSCGAAENDRISSETCRLRQTQNLVSIFDELDSFRKYQSSATLCKDRPRPRHILQADLTQDENWRVRFLDNF